uniref:Leucine-rich repeat extensin-like protein 3 n=1 Tax=Steinernema glaseri TaxID=37863 RepID=A0A1I7ZZ81_9BILA
MESCKLSTMQKFVLLAAVFGVSNAFFFPQQGCGCAPPPPPPPCQCAPPPPACGGGCGAAPPLPPPASGYAHVPIPVQYGPPTPVGPQQYGPPPHVAPVYAAPRAEPLPPPAVHALPPVGGYATGK